MSSHEIPIETYGVPKNWEWGPLLWQMLHGCAEKLGKAPNTMMFQDQRREMIFVLRYVELIMPCQLCRSHYKEWRTKHPLEKLPETQAEFREALRNWLFTLHEEVNQTRGFTSGLSLENLSKMYIGYDLKELGRQFDFLLQRAIRLKAVDREAARKFSTHYAFLSRIL